MKKLILIVLLFSIINAFSQEKKANSSAVFGNPPQSIPRFTEDINLSKSENKKSFQKRIQAHFNKHLFYNKNSFFNDSIKEKIIIIFKIDSLGKAKFVKIIPQKLNKKKLIKEVTSTIDMLPIFIPATMRHKNIGITYSLPMTPEIK